MRVAALSDIHGNLAALEAVLADVEREGVDAIVVAGDSVSGPWPAEVFDRLEAVGARIVRGNADRLDEVKGFDPDQGAWNEERLGADRLATVAGWPLTLGLEVDGLGTVLVCHSTPVSDEPIYTQLTPDEEVIATLGPVEADVLVCGHTHMQYERKLSNGLRLVNPGSVGMPYEGRRGAFWGLLGPDVEFRHTEYDVEKAIDAIRALGAPVQEERLELLVDPLAPEFAAAEFEKLRAT
ncbi:MAG TPA: YfcE family phosphodiesterase [Gaiellaceae bacterium]|jgi:putative phosphoesterase|nr:YfcE family phosphodiesterase [Gaiellaceae bacterium]